MSQTNNGVAIPKYILLCAVAAVVLALLGFGVWSIPAVAVGAGALRLFNAGLEHPSKGGR